MSSKLAIPALIALSVSKLTAALAEHDYTAEELNEAIVLERDSQNRSTAIEAIEDVLEDGADKPSGLVVAKGKSITSKVGVRDSGEEVTADMLPNGEKSLELLEKAGILVAAE